jgi:6-phosphogluconolactonase
MKKNIPFSRFAIAMAIAISAFANLVPISAADDGASIVYVSESGDNRIAVFSLDEKTGDLKRQSQLDLPGSPGSLAYGKNDSRLFASVRTTKEFASIAVNKLTGDLSNPVTAPAGCNASYVHVDRSGKWLLSAAYIEGVVTVSRIDKGIVTGEPVATMKTGARAHCVMTDAANRFAFVPHVMDLNKVEQIRFDAATGNIESNTPPHVSGAAGAGPRHLDFHPNGRWVYLVNEQGQSVTHGDYDAAKGAITLRDTVSTTPPDWDKSKGSCADIHVSADGKFVYASNRGHDSLAVFSVSAETGALTSLGQTPTEKTPRSFALVAGDRFVISAGQGSNKLVVYRRDATSGALTPLRTYDCGKSPAWVLGVRMLSEKF